MKTKQEIAEEAKEMIENASEEVGRVQVILLGGGGWIDTKTWDVEEE